MNGGPVGGKSPAGLLFYIPQILEVSFSNKSNFQPQENLLAKYTTENIFFDYFGNVGVVYARR